MYLRNINPRLQYYIKHIMGNNVFYVIEIPLSFKNEIIRRIAKLDEELKISIYNKIIAIKPNKIQC